MSATWIAERVSVVDHRRALRNVLLGLDDVGWGPNNTFRFPRSGGTGEIYRRLAGAARRQRALRARARRARHRASGAPVRGRRARGVRRARLDDADRPARRRDRRLPRPRCARPRRRSSTTASGRRASAASARSRTTAPGSTSPTPTVPFYRVTNFAKYAAANVPGGGHGALLVVHDRDVVLRAPAAASASGLERARGRRARRDGADRRGRADRVGPHDRRRLRLSDPHAATATRRWRSSSPG